MKSHELEAFRRLLFFSVPEAAAMISGTSEQAWRRWEAGTRRVPDDVAQKMVSLTEWRQKIIGSIVNRLKIADFPIQLVWYKSLDDWVKSGHESIKWRPQQSAYAAVCAEFPGRVRLINYGAPAYFD